MKNNQTSDPITALSLRFMQEVVNHLPVGTDHRPNADLLEGAIKDRLKAFLMGDEYKNDREALQAGTVSEYTVFASLRVDTISRYLRALANRIEEQASELDFLLGEAEHLVSRHETGGLVKY